MLMMNRYEGGHSDHMLEIHCVHEFIKLLSYDIQTHLLID